MQKKVIYGVEAYERKDELGYISHNEVNNYVP